MILKKGFNLITDTSISLTLVSPIRPQFWANIGIPYSKSGIIRTRKVFEMQKKNFANQISEKWGLCYSENAAKVLTQLSQFRPQYWLIIGIPYCKISYFHPCRRVKHKTTHVKVPSCEISASPHQEQCIYTQQFYYLVSKICLISFKKLINFPSRCSYQQLSIYTIKCKITKRECLMRFKFG